LFDDITRWYYIALVINPMWRSGEAFVRKSTTSKLRRIESNGRIKKNKQRSGSSKKKKMHAKEERRLWTLVTQEKFMARVMGFQLPTLHPLLEAKNYCLVKRRP